MKTTSLKIEMTAAQAARIDKLAGALRVTPEKLVKVLVLSNLDGWEDAETFLEVWPGARDFYAARASAGRQKIEDAVAVHLASLFGTKPHKRAA